MKHLYIHIPFCKNICSYCDFCKMYHNSNFVNSYLDALKREVEEYYNDDILDTIYIGGGTPSCLNTDELNKLFEIINAFKVSDNFEFTFECNPSDITEELIDILVKNKVNRLSIGVESFDIDNLGFMDRTCNFEDLKNKIEMIRNKGINNINLDLIYAVPGETLKVLKKDLKLLLKLKPNHISTYSLMIEKHTKLYNEGILNIDEDLDNKMYNLIVKTLKKNKYNHYEVSNFSLNSYESKHNLSYWNNEEYYGFGLGASGYIHGFRYENTRNLNKYLNGSWHNYEELLSEETKMDDEIMLGLRKIKGINLTEFKNKYNKDLLEAYDIKELLNNKELIIKNGYIFINPKYIYMMNEILIKII